MSRTCARTVIGQEAARQVKHNSVEKKRKMMTTNPTTTAKELLKVMQIRLTMQETGITNPPEAVKTATKALVDQLSQFPDEEKISIVIEETNGKYTQQSTGKVLADIPRRGLEEIDDEMRKTLIRCGVLEEEKEGTETPE